MAFAYRNVAARTRILAIVISLTVCILSPTILAHTATDYAVFAGIGYSDFLKATGHNTFLVIPAQPPASAEIDQLSQQGQNNSVGYTIGFSRAYNLIGLTNPTLQGIMMGLTLRYDPTTFSGQVWQYQDPAQNNYRYVYQIRPLSFLEENDLLITKFQQALPFVIVGVGFTEAGLTYRETAINGAEPVSAQTGSGWVIQPDIAAGAGLLWNFKNHRYFIKTQYLYQYRGMARLAMSVFAQGVPVNLNEQSVDILFGVRF